MAWEPLSDSVTVTEQDALRIRILGGYISDITEGNIRQYLSDYTMLSILKVDRVLFVGWDVTCAPTGALTVGQIRAMVNSALDMMRSEWLLFAPGMTVDTISVKRGFDIEVPVTTTMFTVAIAILALVGVWIVTQVRQK